MSNTMMQQMLPKWKTLPCGAEVDMAFDGGVSFSGGAVCTFAHTIAPYIGDAQGISVPKGRRRRT